MRYLIQYIAGTGDLIVQAIVPFAVNLEVEYRDDSAMIFKSSSHASMVGSVPFAKNVFAVIAETSRGDIDKGVSRLGRLLDGARFPDSLVRGRGFRVMVHVDGGFSRVGERSKASIERVISSRTGQRVEPRGMCQEYWVVGRQDLGKLLLCVRLPKEKRPPKARGEISYELSSMLVEASRPTREDVFLDPFAGSGSFILARLGSPARKILYSDLELRRYASEFPQELAAGKRIQFLAEDALSLPSIPDGSVDVIVTDPPWGEHDKMEIPYAEFAESLAASFRRVLKAPGGRYVILTSRRTAILMEHALSGNTLSPDSRHEILVNGHPATVLIGPKSPYVSMARYPR